MKFLLFLSMMLCVWGQYVQPFELWKNMTRHKSGDQPVKINMPGHFIRMKFQIFTIFTGENGSFNRRENLMPNVLWKYFR